MDTLQISKANAVKAYNSATTKQQELLVNLFGADTFKKVKSGKITDRVKTLEDAIAELGITVNWSLYENLSKDEIAYLKLKIIARALNEGWTPNWDNDSEYKYWPYFDMRSSAAGFGFSDSDFGGWRSISSVGSRLCYKSSELSEYAGTQFLDVYRDMMVL